MFDAKMKNERLIGQIQYENLIGGSWNPQINHLLDIYFNQNNPDNLFKGTRSGPSFDSSVLCDSKEKGHPFYKSFREHLAPENPMEEEKSVIKYSKPDAVQKLEELLSAEYNSKVEVTCINELPITRKQVKEVYFLIENSLSKVWIFKADPMKTRRELDIYDIAHKHHLPTGRPIGYHPNPETKSYPYNIAIIGGEIIEHAGEPYNLLLNNLREKPEIIFRTAKAVASMIADYQIKLTLAIEDMQQRGIEMEAVRPRKEIFERISPAIDLSVNKLEGLVNAFENLYDKLSGVMIVSHGDIHTGNIVTHTKNDPTIGKLVTKIDRFGIIDWDSLGFDNPLGDALDFWVHHKRAAQKVCSTYDFCADEFIETFAHDFNNLGKAHNIYLDSSKSVRDSCIESALWNLYEMFDPVRKNSSDIEQKAKTHLLALLVDLDKLESFNMHDEVFMTKREIKRVFSTIPYLAPILK